MQEPPLPPRWAESLITRLAPEGLAEEIRGDLYEMFVVDLKHGHRYAQRKYAINSLGFLLRSFFWNRSRSTNRTSVTMTSNYFKMASRSLMVNKSTTTINILGLVIGIASALVILTVIRYELSFDSFHSDRDRIYRLVRVSGNDVLEYRSGISYPVGDALKNEISDITKVASIEYFGATFVDRLSNDGKTQNKFREESGLAVIGPDFFDLFDYKDKPIKWIAGNPKTALDDPQGMVIVSSLAKKYFGNEDPIGQTLRLEKRFVFQITGVIEDFPQNSDFPFTMLLSKPFLKTVFGDALQNEWVSVNDSHSVFLLAKEGASKESLEAQIAKVHTAHVKKDIADVRKYKLQEFSELHFDPRFGNFSQRTISHETILALEVIVLFLLLAACINYINLATAQSTLRSKEIGLRKVMGSSQRHLIMQFLTETFVVVTTAAILAMVVVEASLPSLQNLINLKIAHYNFTDPFILVCVAIIIVSVTLLSGVYPALTIAKFNPIQALRSKFATDNVGGINLRKVLVVTQFTITQILTVGTFIVVSQMKFFQDVDMGFNKDSIITLKLLEGTGQSLNALETELRTLPVVANVSASFTLPSGRERSRSSRTIGKPGGTTINDFVSFEYCPIDENFLDLYKIKLIAGRPLTNHDTVGQILINEVLVRKLELGTPQEALGTLLHMPGKGDYTVTGVIGDYYGNSLKEGVDYTILMINPKEYNWLSIKLDLNEDQSMTEALLQVEKIWNANYPEHLFLYQFLDDNVKAFYQQEYKYSKLFQLFAFIFMLIGCLGLYGLITFIVNKKGKEIAVRKTLGASIANIITLFSKEYVILIGISFLLAVPVAYFAVTEWLSNFKNHVPLSWWLFAAPGVFVLLLALVVVAAKSFTAARLNPVEKLKNE